MQSPQRVVLDKKTIIKQLGLFSDLTPNQQDIIARASDFYEYKKDSIVYGEGDPADAFYYVISGRVRIFTKNRSGGTDALEYMHRGGYFGIISILTGEPHSVAVQVINDAVILKIPRENFLAILKAIPKLAIHFSATLSRRLKQKTAGQKVIFESTIISIYGIQHRIGRTLYALNLARSLKREASKKVIFLDMALSDEEGVIKYLPIKDRLTPLEMMPVFFDEVKVRNSILNHESGISILRIPSEPDHRANKIQIIPLLSYLTNIFDYCIIDLPFDINTTVLTTLSQSDYVHVLTDSQPENINSVNNFIGELEGSIRSPETKIKIIVNEAKGKIERAGIFKYGVYATLADINTNEKEYLLAVRRIAREVSGILVGLVLGSGAAWGLAQIGIIKVLEKENVPVDVVIGSSMGALIGAFWAAGHSGADMERIAIESKKQLRIFGLSDLKFPISGLISDARTVFILRTYLGEKTFREIRFPLKVVCTDLGNRMAVVLESGRLRDAVRASISIPGIFSPVKYGGRYLIDGGIAEPVPVSPLFKMGVRKIIAVNTLPSQDDMARMPAADTKKNLANFLRPNILDTIIISIETLECSMAEAGCRQADVVIHPAITGWSWQDFLNPENLIALGEEACMAKLPEIKRLIEN